MTSRPYSAINKNEDEEDDDHLAPLSADASSTPRVKLIPPKKIRESASPQQGGTSITSVEVQSSGQTSNVPSPACARLPPLAAGPSQLSTAPATSSSAEPSSLSGKRSASTAGSPPISSAGFFAPSSSPSQLSIGPAKSPSGQSSAESSPSPLSEQSPPLPEKLSASTAGSPPQSPVRISAPSSGPSTPLAEEPTRDNDATVLEVENPQCAPTNDVTLQSASLILDKTADTSLSKTATSLNEDPSEEANNLEISFADKLSLDQPSVSRVDPPTTHGSETSQKSVTFQVGKLKKPSTFGRNPSFGKAVTAGLARRSQQNDEAEPASLNDQSSGDNSAKPSIVGTPTPSSKMLQPEYGTADELKGALLSTVEEETEEASLLEQAAAAALSSSGTSSSTQGEDGKASLASFMEEEMKAIAEQACQCPRFEAIMKEYSTLREKCDPMAKIGDTSANAHLEEEVARLSQELEQKMMELEECGKRADLAKKEATDYEFLLDEEKRRAKASIAQLQKENFALSDLVETLTAGKNGASGDATNQEKDVMSLKLQQQIADLEELYAKAVADTEEYKNRAKFNQKASDDVRKAMNDQVKAMKDEFKAEIEKLKSEVDYHRDINISMQKVASANEAALKLHKNSPLGVLQEKVESGEKEIASLKAALTSEEQLSNIRLADMQQQKEAEIYMLNGEIAALQTEMAKLEDELKICNDVLQKGEEAEALCEQYKAKIDALEKRVLESNALAAGKDAELCRIQKAYREEIVPQFEEKIGELKKRLLKSDETEKVNEQLMAQNSVLEKESIDLRAQLASNTSEIEELKNLFGREKAKLQDESSELEAQLSKAEEACRELLEAKDVVQMENSSLNRLLANKLAEREQLQSTFEAESVKLNDEIRGLKGQVEAAGAKLEEYKASNEKLQLYIAKGKKHLNEKEDLIASLKAAHNVLEMDKVELMKLCDSKEGELAQLKLDFAQEKADLEVQVAQKEHYLGKAIEENGVLRQKVSVLYDQADTDAAERKGLAETVYALQTKLCEYGDNGVEMRATIDMAKTAPAKPSPSVDTLSYKSAAEGDQKENDSSTMKDDNTAAEALEEGGVESQLGNGQQGVGVEEGQPPNKSHNMSCSTQ